MSYSGPEGEGSFRVTLRLATPARYQIQAVDPVGRSLWSLDVANDAGLWLNHRARTFCLFEGRFDVEGAPIGPFPLLSLPSLLVGRVPGEPVEGTEAETKDGEVRYQDESGRRWAVTVGDAGQIHRWTLSEAGAPVVWWMYRDDWSILSDRERGVQIRWREVLRENLDQEPQRLEAPSGYRETPCDPELAVEPAPE